MNRSGIVFVAFGMLGLSVAGCGGGDAPAAAAAPPPAIPAIPVVPAPPPAGPRVASCMGGDWCMQYENEQWDALGVDDAAREAYAQRLCGMGEHPGQYTRGMTCRVAGATGGCVSATSTSIYYSSEYLANRRINCEGEDINTRRPRGTWLDPELVRQFNQ